MKGFLRLVGVALITFGASGLVEHGFTYPKKEKVVDIGAVHVTRDTKRTMHIPLALSGMMIAFGALLMIPVRKEK